MALNPKLIGKSLLKFFKPLRVGQIDRDPDELHRPACGYVLYTAPTANLEKLTNKKTPTLATAEPTSAMEHKTSHNVAEQAQAQKNVPLESASWLDHVEYLSGLCKTVATKMTGSFGSKTYKSVVDSQVKQKIKVIGSIINLTDSKDDPLKITAGTEEDSNLKKNRKPKQKPSPIDDVDEVELSTDAEKKSAA